MKKTPLIIGAVVAAAVLFVCSSTYNGVIPLDESTSRTTAEVQTMLGRQAELLPNLAATVKGSSDFEKDTFTQVSEARSAVGAVAKLNPRDIANDPKLQAQVVDAQAKMQAASVRVQAMAEATRRRERPAPPPFRPVPPAPASRWNAATDRPNTVNQTRTVPPVQNDERDVSGQGSFLGGAALGAGAAALALAESRRQRQRDDDDAEEERRRRRRRDDDSSSSSGGFFGGSSSSSSGGSSGSSDSF